ncbi:17255_t:CDS:1 [Acaulospora morrowiae]|uniref:17255_t:CDS:1 n=1 Tax=Acaulospora morrowiae TaxID=94023 RepID=A0A9N9HD35_9GLOM|nr:17255_t:CDS:1 [Acaulospora morrowiae]
MILPVYPIKTIPEKSVDHWLILPLVKLILITILNGQKIVPIEFLMILLKQILMILLNKYIPASGISDITSNPDKYQEETKSRVTNSSPTTTIYTKLKSSKEKEVDDFFDLLEKERISNIMRERNREKKFQCESPSQEAHSVSQNTASTPHGRKNEQGLIREMILSKEEIT